MKKKAYLAQLNSVMASLCEALRLPAHKENVFTGHVIYETASLAFKDIKKRNEFHAYINLSRISLVLKNVKEIEAIRPDLLQDFRKKIRKCTTTDNYNGLRFELNIAASFSRAGLDFTRSETPDYFVRHQGVIFSVECTSTRLSEFMEPKEYIHKIRSALRKKEKHSHYGSTSSLFIDITNIARMAMVKDDLFDHNIFKKEIKEHLAEHQTFGNVLMFVYKFDHKRKVYEMGYSRLDAEYIHPTLKNFMDTYYPIVNKVFVEGDCTIATEA